MSYLKKLSAFGVFTFGLALATPAFAATDPIVEFCAGPVAKADAAAVAECAEYQKSLAAATGKKGEKDTAQAAVDAINAEIRLAEQKIKLQNTIISKLSKDIGAKTQVVASLQGQIDRQSQSIGDIVKMVNMHDAVSVPAVFLGSESLSDFYTEVDTLYTLNKQLVRLVDEVKASKAETENERQTLEDRKDRETNAREAIESERKLIERKKTEKAAILALKTGEYNIAQKLADDKKAKVAEIRSRLFKFQDGEGITFGEAYDYALKASKTTAVRPAFLLAILQQESSKDENDVFGKHIGDCFITDYATGAGINVKKNTTAIRVLKPDRDVAPFLKLTEQLGRNPKNTPIACWYPYYVSGQPSGWGGGLGPTQFIPSTWALYGGYPAPSYSYDSSKDRIRKALGLSSASDPFNPQHAITASSFMLSDLGAGLQTAAAEKKAACKYYAGGVGCSSAAGNSYGNSVMKKVKDIEQDILLLQL
ncbi:MAG TPA: hypothetical protein VGE35_02080 [Candidatus Paceibacterota bacterium]